MRTSVKGRHGGRFCAGGAIEAFAEAKEKGYVRFTGLGGHEDPM